MKTRFQYLSSLLVFLGMFLATDFAWWASFRHPLTLQALDDYALPMLKVVASIVMFFIALEVARGLRRPWIGVGFTLIVLLCAYAVMTLFLSLTGSSFIQALKLAPYDSALWLPSAFTAGYLIARTPAPASKPAEDFTEVNAAPPAEIAEQKESSQALT